MKTLFPVFFFLGIAFIVFCIIVTLDNGQTGYTVLQNCGNCGAQQAFDFAKMLAGK